MSLSNEEIRAVKKAQEQVGRIADSPAVRAMQEIADSPTFRAMQEVAGETRRFSHIQQELANSPMIRQLDELAKRADVLTGISKAFSGLKGPTFPAIKGPVFPALEAPAIDFVMPKPPEYETTRAVRDLVAINEESLSFQKSLDERVRQLEDGRQRMEERSTGPKAFIRRTAPGALVGFAVFGASYLVNYLL